MWLTVLGGSGGIPAEGVPCSGYLVEHDGFRLLVDPGYGSAVALLRHCRAADVDAVFVTHAHPDHCADLNPLLRMRVMGRETASPLPIYCPTGAVDRVLALEPTASYDEAYELHEFGPDDKFSIDAFAVETRSLPHFTPNAGVRFTIGSRSLTYTGDCGPSDALIELASGTSLLLAEATYLDHVPDEHRGCLSDAASVGQTATKARAERLVLTHLWPGANHDDARRVAGHQYDGRIDVARPRLVVQI
ncbi:MBL fold metallo-hydrolase [Solicola gregarius]|uniref:MBL fold metallo-hydrolase n=1 Tax=Solicola gregarius TaxID=2908642 RepID=A0AA46THV4_9ACTN|nr:MBL fold metallo-hydrolase [Solicola gregarius]UYM05596.1 MBL fold metallo-hydrolase [Solicola gregarius]